MKTNTINAETIFNDLKNLRQQTPLVHNITNFVAMNSSANILLALGASPLMAHAPEEIPEIEKISGALVLNIGTLDTTWIAAMKMAQKYALQQKIPIILDPVGAGASALRTTTAQTILHAGVQVVRGNGSEIMALANYSAKTKGVETSITSNDAISAAQQLAEKYQCVVVISGADDFIVIPDKIVKLSNGTALFTKVTAMGCGATAVIGAFAAINKDYVAAAIHAMATFAIAGECVAANVNTPGSFYVAFLDKLYSLNNEDLKILRIS